MSSPDALDRALDAASDVAQLRERAKELACLYRVHEVLLDRTHAPSEVFRRVLEAIPDGWQRPETTRGTIECFGRLYAVSQPNRGASQSAEIRTWGKSVGTVRVVDTARAEEDPNAFLREEQALLDAIAARLGEYLEWKQQELMGEPIGAATAQWRWRQQFAERLAAALDPDRFGVKKLFVTGSTERGDAEPPSDLDLVVVFAGTPAQRHDLSLWLEGWSLCLAEVAARQGGWHVDGGLLDVSWRDEEPGPVELVRLRELALGGG